MADVSTTGWGKQGELMVRSRGYVSVSGVWVEEQGRRGATAGG